MSSHLSQEFIAKQKERLLQDKQTTQKEIEELRKDDPFSNPEHANDNAAVDSDSRDEDLHSNIEAQMKELERRVEDIDIALQKIEKGTYGVCEKSNQPIPQQRLEVVPEARYLVELS